MVVMVRVSTVLRIKMQMVRFVLQNKCKIKEKKHNH